MKTRVVSIAMVLGLGLCLLAPLGAAQVRYVIEWAHPTMELPENGRADMKVTVDAYINNVVCPPGAVLTTDLKLSTFAKWAGSSMEPLSASWNVPQGPTAAEAKLVSNTPDIVLNFAWNVEDRPAKGAKQDYVLSTDSSQIEPACLPDPQKTEAKSTPMTATIADKPDIVNATGAVDCQSDPFNPLCANAATTAPAESPALDAGILLGALAVFAVVFRRRRA